MTSGGSNGGTRFERAIAAIDAANADDPFTIVVRGVTRPKELAHAELATEWLSRLCESPSEPLLLAIRAHHLRRWAVPRDSYPDGRAGYLRWKRDLQQRHAAETGALLRSAGYEDDTVARVEDIIRKRGLARDPEVQLFEDALCLVFVETQFDDLTAKTEREVMVGLVRKTLAKMSPAALRLAASLAPALSDESQTILAEASES